MELQLTLLLLLRQQGFLLLYTDYAPLFAALWNRTYFLRFRFRLLESYGSGSDF
jgi:hypothetical protein